MSSEESDDEPLAVLAAAKKVERSVRRNHDIDIDYDPKPKKRKTKKAKALTIIKPAGLTIQLGRKPPPLIQRPEDVWLYLKDFNPSGPYSCLLCNEWFLSKSKIVVHYILNHKKDYCGICRYFVTDRSAWDAHMKFHIPWPCSQCDESFATQGELRHHLCSAHNLVHCRMCHFRVPADEQYEDHLAKKHNVSNMTCKGEEILWEMELESQTFLCSLCSKPKNSLSTFFSHYMGYHHFTMKCIGSILGGRDTEFTLYGADITREFIDGLKDQKRGYVELDRIAAEIKNEQTLDLGIVKEEVPSDTEDKKEAKKEVTVREDFDSIKCYKGDTDFDVTRMEVILLKNNCFDYLNQLITEADSNTISVISNIEYEKETPKEDEKEVNAEIDCSLCKSLLQNLDALVAHMCKMHNVKSVPVFSCRLCVTTFDSLNELETHISEELGEFDDLWICQFCDLEFNDRPSARKHLEEHVDILESDNCFSPHLGFKCRYCFSLFWNELDRERHQKAKHFVNNEANFYKCECNEIFSDKIWFTYHYLKMHQDANPSTTCLFKCCICSVVLSSVSLMRGHFDIEHREAKKIFCSLEGCQYRPLCHKKSFQLHLRSFHRSARRDVACTCAVCGREFPNARACGVHTAQSHGPGKFKCAICKVMLHSMDERKLHYLLRHPDKHPYVCKECGKTFQYKSALYVHKKEHSTVQQDFTCNICQKVFAKKDSYREHIQIHEGPRHACSYCPMRFVQRSNMLRHERRHTGERPYACPHCERTFADKGACTSHVRTHTRDTSFPCLYCGQTFAQKSKLTYHIRRHTGENLETCSICAKVFTSACSLREHLKTHEVKKRGFDVKCPLCDRTYQDTKYMVRHLRDVHTAHRPPCPVCGKRLSSAAGLRHHVLTHSERNMFWCKFCPKSYAVKRTMVRHLRRRHGLKGSEINVKDFYKRLDPRECRLKLDEETITSIFGEPKKRPGDVGIGDFITFPNQLNQERENTDENNDDDENEEEYNEENEEYNEENEEEKEEIEEKYIPTTVMPEMNEPELEPTDFVSVKIEPLDE